jgi:hypothetical protein
MRCSIRRGQPSLSSAPGSARLLGPSALTCLGRHTLSGLLCAAGQQFCDWCAACRLLERERLNEEVLWRVPLSGVLQTLPPSAPVVALIDDTLIRKRGHRNASTSWRRDPLGPQFADNFIWASRFLQISLALPEHPEGPASAARAISIDLRHAPSARKPSRRAGRPAVAELAASLSRFHHQPPWSRTPHASTIGHRSERGRGLSFAARLCRRLFYQPNGAARTVLGARRRLSAV